MNKSPKPSDIPGTLNSWHLETWHRVTAMKDRHLSLDLHLWSFIFPSIRTVIYKPDPNVRRTSDPVR